MQRLELSQHLSQSLRQEQIMAPQQIQALEILLATVPELEQKISEALAENPTLELVKSGSEQLAGNPVEDGPRDTSAADERDEEAVPAAMNEEAQGPLFELNRPWRDHSPYSTQTQGAPSEESEERRRHFFDSLTQEDTLQDTLLTQLREAEGPDGQTFRIGEHIIGSIDNAGYLRSHPSDIAISTSSELADVQRVLTLVQSFDPPGVAARDLRECLLLQLERKGRKDSLAYAIVAKHLEDLGRNQLPRIQRALKTSRTAVYAALEEIRDLSPHPGSQVESASPSDFVYPEVFIENANGQWTVRSNRAFSPRLRLSPHYLNMLQDEATSREAKAYIREKINSSKLLLRAIAQRQSTIERIGASLLKFQRDFFEQGAEGMRPLTMSQVATDVGVHETTVSRAIANKYVQTPHGLFQFKHFFTTGYTGDGGEAVSSLSIKEKLQALISGEEPERPLSDQKLVALLRQQGFSVARRTVAKYRDELGIQPSHMRRSF